MKLFFLLTTSLLCVFFSVNAQSPGGISSGLKVWLKADAGTSTTVNGALVTAWNDQSGNNLHHAQATSAKQPRYAGAGSNYLINYNPALTFDGGDDINPASQYFNSTDAFHVFSVSRINGAGATAWQSVASFYVDNNHSDWFNQQVSCRTGAVEKNNTTKNIRYGLSASLMPKTGNQTVIWNGTPASFANTAYSLNYPGVPYNFYSIGSDAGTDYLNGDIQEVIIYGGPGVTMSANDVQRLQSYLAIKYGISLDPTGQANYIASDNTTQCWTGTSNTGYQNNIFGLGRDDNSNLYQKQTYSMGDSSISVYLGNTLAALNSQNVNSINADHSFLMLGDNNLTGYTTYGIYPTGTAFSNGASTGILNFRSNRIWRSQTSTQPAWTVSINTNKFGFGNDPATTVYIMVSSDAVFTPANTRLYKVTNGTVNGVVINNGEYMSIAAYITSPGGVSDQLVFWSKTDNATAGAAWPDNSINHNAIEINGAGPTLAAANAAHNYHPYYTGFTGGTGGNYFRDINPSFTPTDNSYGVPTRTSYSFFSAVRPTSAGTGKIAGIDNDAYFASEPGFAVSAGKPYFYKFYEGAYPFTATPNITTNKSSIIAYNAAQASPVTNGGTLNLALDGVGQNFTIAAGEYFHILGQYFLIGNASGWDTPTPFPGDIMELAWYKKSLSAAEASRVNSYLALKNGVTLGTMASPVDYVNTAGSTIWSTAASTFQNNVAGIGRDDLEGLNQKQSTSVNANTNGQVVMALGTLAASNAANAGVFAKDNTYQVWGDNGITTSLATASTAFLYDGSSLNLRMNRIWRLQNTNLSQQVQITIPQTMLGTTGNAVATGCQKLRLVVATDAGFTTIISATTNLILSGGVYTCAVKFPAGTSFFTFARIENGAEGVADLPVVNTASVSNTTCEELGWRYWYADGTQGLNNGTRRIFAINRNGNGTAAVLDNFTGQVNYQPAVHEVTDGTNTTHIMGRSLTINDPSAGTYPVGGGMKVRFYIDSTELLNTILNAAVSSKWFKYPSSLANMLADQTPETVKNCTWYTNLLTGTEDGVDYIEYSGVSSFSTFGFASNAGNSAVLPVKIHDFSASKITDNTIANLNWQVGVEEHITSYEVLRSNDAINFETIATVPATGRKTYNHKDYQPMQGRNYYRLRIIDMDGNIAYSDIRLVDFATNQQSVFIYPNPATKNNLIQVKLQGYTQGAKATVYNSSGQVVYSSFLANGNNILSPLTKLVPGIYAVKITNIKTGMIETSKLVIN